MENPGVRGKFKVSAGVVYKNRLVATGINSYRTHPIMLNGDYRVGQVCLHAEVDAILRASKVLSDRQLQKSTIYITRVKKDEQGNWTEALARPCCGCMSLIQEVGIRNMEWTVD